MFREVDVRGVLQYVPQFRGRTFVILLDDGNISEAALAESLLDILSLQRVGVRLLLGTLSGDLDDLVDWATELEFKAARPMDSLDHDRAREILDRGQAGIFDASGVAPLGDELVEMAKSVGASKLIYLFNGDRVTLNGSPVTAVLTSQIDDLEAEGELVGRDVLEAASRACASGIPRVHLLNGSVHGVLVQELFSTEGVGTMVYDDHYLTTRALREEDIPELLAMIGRTVRATWLVPRNYEDIRERMEDYLVLTIDDNVVGCVALYPYPEENVSEVACLYVKQTHEKRGYGKILVDAAVEVARQRKNERVIALTTRAASFFQKSLNWSEVPPDTLPSKRFKQWKDGNRGSLVFQLDL